MQQKPSRTHTVLLYKTYHTPPVQLLHNYQILVFMHKYVHYRHQLPSVFSAYFDENNLIHHYNTRKKDDFHTYSVQSEIGKRAIKFKDSKLCNNLPADIKALQSSSSFSTDSGIT